MRHYLKPLLVVILLVLTFRLMSNLPLAFINKLATTLYIGALSVFYFLYWMTRLQKQTLRYIDIIMLFSILYVFVTAFQARAVFGQPISYGIVTQGTSFLIFSGLFIYVLLMNRQITIRSVERALFITGMAMVCIILAFYLFADPHRFSEYEFVNVRDLKGVVYKFAFTIVIFLFLYSAISILRKHYSWVHVAGLVLSFTYLFAYQQKRSVLIALVLTLVIYFAKNFSFVRNVKYYFYFAAGIGALFVIGLILKPESASRFFILFGNLIAGSQSEEASISVRFIEMNIAFDYIRQNPILGSGLLDNAWQDGFQGRFGHFYPGDIGIVGNLFAYGILGVIVIYLPLVYAYVLSRRIGLHTNVLLHASQYLLVYLFIQMFFRASNIGYLSELYFYVFIIYYFYKSGAYAPNTPEPPATADKATA